MVGRLAKVAPLQVLARPRARFGGMGGAVGAILENCSCKFACITLSFSAFKAFCSSLRSCGWVRSWVADGRFWGSLFIICLIICSSSGDVEGSGSNLFDRMSCHSWPFMGRGRPRQISYIVAPREKMSLLVKSE